jgi:DNA polymerase-3 subunit delta'
MTAATAIDARWQTVGHDHARRFLQSSLQTDRLAHAYLITGPERVGRMALALDLARAVNCDSYPAGPCGECRQCGRITRGLHSDVRVIDRHTPIRGVGTASASTPEEDERSTGIKIDHIRELQHEAALNPFEGRSHVFILDAAETMRAEAANCLLKTLEEPADGVLLILIASSPAALRETIVSRCQVVTLRPVPVEEIASALVSRESCAPDEAGRIAKLARGRPGWAFSAASDPTALDRYRQAVLRLTDAVEGGLDDRFRYARELATAFRRDRDSVFEELDLWQAWWRDVLLIKHDLRKAVLHVEWRDALEAVARQVEAADAARAVDAARSAADALSRNAVAQLALEVMMLDLPRIEGPLLPEAGPDGVGSERADEDDGG